MWSVSWTGFNIETLQYKNKRFQVRHPSEMEHWKICQVAPLTRVCARLDCVVMRRCGAWPAKQVYGPIGGVTIQIGAHKKQPYMFQHSRFRMVSCLCIIMSMPVEPNALSCTSWTKLTDAGCADILHPRHRCGATSSMTCSCCHIYGRRAKPAARPSASCPGQQVQSGLRRSRPRRPRPPEKR